MHRQNPGRPHVVYLGGFGRSGSTLLERVLGGIPGWTNVGELVDLPRSVYVHEERCGCGEPFAGCPFWTKVGVVAHGTRHGEHDGDHGWDPASFERLAALRWQVARQRQVGRLLALARGRGVDSALARLVQEYQSGYGQIYRAVAEVSDSHVVVDASKGPAHGLALGLRPSGRTPWPDPGYDLTMVNLVRDPRGVAYSWSRRQQARPQAGTARQQMWTISPQRSAVQWAALQSEMAAITSVGGVRGVRLRYEDLMADPRSAVADLLAALELPLPTGDLDHLTDDGVHLGASHGLSGNPGRFASGTLALRVDTAWAAEMPRSERRLVTALTAPWLVTYGYPLATRTLDRTDQNQDQDMTITSQENAETSGPTSYPLVSVVIPTRGRPELLRETLASIIGQDYAGEMDIVVVHDREDPDPTLTELSRPGRTVRSIFNDGTPGLAGGRNTGLRNTSGEIVASCDDDDLWHPAKIRRQVERLQSDPQLLAVGAGIRLLMGDRDVDWPGQSPVVTHRRLLGNRVKELHSSTLAMWRRSFAKAGQYDEDLPHGYGEDYDWLLRATRVGKVGVVNEVLADIRKDVPSWFRGKALNTADALEYMLDKHDFESYRPGHARVLGQIAYAKATAGERKNALRYASRALRTYPLAPHAWLGLLSATTGVGPQKVLTVARRFGRGVS